ncbi:MAG TPA: dolichyl-phosphate beta-D-mannosyltransferase [Flavobacteriales bacterium]|nr:dolichyl-phosphate beta-D-mannosyltransferase [Flavobacteriales bacterium]HRE73341.1 polyprenol monophosphomannose synthase [Flavobacteriales bacterium]HRE97451.1 polyprenol monophosphomannose synthase [Flavobacteriales bacterium]HRJ39205.1 polyprenol monophosphomannose synthase [Flavobacteriales bacterium]
MSDSIVIIPTFNEKENIERILRKVFSLDKLFHVLIVDDGSPDGTAEIVRSLMTEYPDRLFMEERASKSGLGTAYIHGFRWSLQHNYSFIFEMDADFSHNPDDLIRLYNACAVDGFDMSVGSRYVKGGKVMNWPFTRWLMSYFASVYVRLILWINIKDTTAGFKCYKRKALETIDLNKIRFVGYAFQIEMKYTALLHGFKIKEVPIVFIDRQLGQSKMSMRIFKEAFWGVFKMRRKKI